MSSHRSGTERPAAGTARSDPGEMEAMADGTYTDPIYVTGDMLASLTGQPWNNGNPGDANFGIVLPGADALGSSDTLYRLTWTGNKNDTATNFANGQFWKLEIYNPSIDNDGDPTTGGAGWSTVQSYNHLTPKNDLVSGLGGGDDYIVFEMNGHYLLLDLNGGLPTTPTTLLYYGSETNGDLAIGDNDGELDFDDAYHAIDAICFCAGTLIETETGPRPIETLAPGDRIRTLDHGFQALRWIGTRRLDALALRLAPQLRPVRIARDALGRGLPAHELLVSPQHRILVRSRVAERMSGAREVLIAAKHLVGLPGIAVVAESAPVTYLHPLFDRHEVVFANGAEAESLYTGRQALRSLTRAARAEIFTLFPELRAGGPAPEAARPLTTGRIGRKLSERHAKNGKPLVMAG